MDRMMQAIAAELAASPAKRKQLLAIVKTPPAKAWSRHGREDLIAAIREQRDAWELMSRRCQDLPDTRLEVESHAQLVQHLKWYYSDEGRAVAAGWLVELLQYVESTDRRLRPRPTTRPLRAKATAAKAAGAKKAPAAQKTAAKKTAAKKTAAKAIATSTQERLLQDGFRYFECKRGGSSKFWAIRVRGRRYTVAYGRIGAQGRVLTKDVGNPGASKHKAETLVREKTAEGYRER